MEAYFNYEMMFTPDKYSLDLDDKEQDQFDEAVSDLESKAESKMDDALEHIIWDLDSDGDVVKGYDVWDGTAVIELLGDSEHDKEVATAILEKLQETMDSFSLTDEILIYGRQVWGGYPSYDPPEYEEHYFDVELQFDYSDEIIFK